MSDYSDEKYRLPSNWLVSEDESLPPPPVKTALLIAVPLLGMALWALWTPDLDRATLERQYLQSPGDMVQVLDQRLHVRDANRSPCCNKFKRPRCWSGAARTR